MYFMRLSLRKGATRSFPVRVTGNPGRDDKGEDGRVGLFATVAPIGNQESKLRKRNSLALASTFSRIAGSGSIRAISVAPIIVEKMEKKARSLSAGR